MNLLLDTHTFLWWIAGSKYLSKTARELITDGANTIYWSAASSWEVAIKYRLGRLDLKDTPENILPAELVKNRIESLPIMDIHAFAAGQLPYHHRDPFDRMLIAQARLESLALISNDSIMGKYQTDILW